MWSPRQGIAGHHLRGYDSGLSDGIRGAPAVDLLHVERRALVFAIWRSVLQRLHGAASSAVATEHIVRAKGGVGSVTTVRAVTIREAVIADGAALARAWSDGGRYHVQLNPELFQAPAGEPLVEHFTARLTDPDSEAVVLVAEIDGTAVGWISAVLQAADENAEFQLQRDLSAARVHVNALMVGEAKRGEGVGTALMRRVESWAVQRGAASVSLDVYIDAPDVVTFYEDHLGYQRRALRLTKRLT